MAHTGIGSIIDDKYEVVALIGQGGMSSVWLATDVRLHKLWAIKEIKPNQKGARGEVMRHALIDEADFLKRLDHPAIPRVVDILDTGQTVYVVMDYVEGRSLGALLHEQGHPFDQAAVVAWGIQLCDVLSYLHHRVPQVIYRDMKPDNVMLRDDGSVRLIDFGIAAEARSQSGHAALPMGTPGYAAPEQLVPEGDDGDPAPAKDARMDIYALGATLYSLVTGDVPQRVVTPDGRSSVVFAMRPIRSWNPQLSEGLEQVLARATQADPDDRYPTIEELRYDLAHHEQLTGAWRARQQRKVAVFRRWLVAAVVWAVVGVASFCVSDSLRCTSYEELMRRASVAVQVAEGDTPSEAERLYGEAMQVRPDRIESYQGLLHVLEGDYRFSDAEDRRWRAYIARAEGIEHDPGYAQLCFDTGVAYLCYYRIDQDGGAVGNAALASVEAAEPWFTRALDANGDAVAKLDPADQWAATAYQLIASFHGRVSRAGKEGRAATEEYRSFWEAFSQAMQGELDRGERQGNAEGVRARLCQVGAEALASSTYLSGFARSGVSESQAYGLLAAMQSVINELRSFAHIDENREVYGPLLDEVDACLAVAEHNIANVYHNPVERMPEGAVG